MQHYKSIMIYGHSFGETDNDFIKFLFSNMMNNSVENNPKFYFITLDSKSKTDILNNLTKQLNTSIDEIIKHVKYEFILTNETPSDIAKSAVHKIMFGQS